jgi:hypothetical protein
VRDLNSSTETGFVDSKHLDFRSGMWSLHDEALKNLRSMFTVMIGLIVIELSASLGEAKIFAGKV